MFSRRIYSKFLSQRTAQLSAATPTAGALISSFRFCGVSAGGGDSSNDAKFDVIDNRLDMLERVVGNLVANTETVLQVLQQQPGGGAAASSTVSAAAVGAQVPDGNGNRNIVPRGALRSVIKVYSSVVPPSPHSPWQTKPLSSATGTSFVVDVARRLLLTNAHVVSYASLIEVRRHGEARRFVASCRFISGDCDLALLHVDDDAFWATHDDAKSIPQFFCESAAENDAGADAASSSSSASASCGLESIARIKKFEGFPLLQHSVQVLGFPVGGDQISITSGVVSRIDQTPYSTSGLRLASVQLDAAINSGNSGGCALVDGKVVGVVFQSLIKAEGIGYLIPNAIVAHFARSFLEQEGEQKKEQQQQEGEGATAATTAPPAMRYHSGFPLVGIYFQELANPTLREYFRLPDNANGFLVEKLVGGSPNADLVKAGDIITKVDNHQIERDTTIEWRPGERLQFTHLIHSRAPGETLSMQLWRDGGAVDIEVKCAVSPSLVAAHLQHPRFANNQLPYTTFCGCVFTVLSVPYLESWGQNWPAAAPRSLVQHFLYGEIDKERLTEIVVLSQILPHAVNRGYSPDSLCHRTVAAVNGKPVKNFETFCALMAEAAAPATSSPTSAEQRHVRITLKDAEFPLTMVLPRKGAKEADELLCKQNGIPFEKSVLGAMLSANK